MAEGGLRVAGLQTDIVWEDREATLARLEPRVAAAAAAGARLVVLAEMFAVGFTMATERVAEPPDGPTTRWLRARAAEHDLWIGGSLPELPDDVPERQNGAGRPSNTFVLAGPDGTLHRRPKVHPFGLAGEDRHYAAGEPGPPVTVDGLRLTPTVCYDLRFADLYWDRARETDVYLVVANWPEARRHHWRTLLAARAIENQAYVVGVNRVGEANGLSYAGDSAVIDPLGEALATAAGGETMVLADLSAERVASVRRSLPFLDDRRDKPRSSD